MKAIYPALLLCFLFPSLKTHALPVDLSAPSGGLGPTSDQGAAVHWLEMTEIDFGEGLALPLRMAFRTNWKSMDDELGGGFWSTPLHESKLHSISNDTKTVLLPCGKQMSLEPAPGKSGTWQTSDGEWVTRQKGPFTVVAREDGWEMEFNAKGQLIRLQNDAKRNVLWTRDAAGRVLSLAELTNGKTQPPAYTVDRDPKTGRINTLSVKTAHGTKQWRNTYEGAKLKRVSFPDTSEVTFNETTRQDGQPQIAITGRDAIVTTLTWDKTSHLLLSDGIWTYTITAQAGSKPIMTRVGPGGETEIQHDDSANHRSLFTAVDGTLTTHQKVATGPGKGKTASITRLLANTDKPTTVYQAEYDARGLLISETDALGRKTTHNYTLHGATVHSGFKLHSSTDPLGHSSSKEYDQRGNLIVITNALGQVTKNEFDPQNRLSKTIGPDGTVVRSMTYNAAGQIATRTDAAGATTKFSYDKDGHPVSTTDALGNVTRDFPDQRGNRIQRRDALGNTWRYEYDKGGRLAQTIAPDGQTTERRKYNSQGRLTEVTDAAGNTETTDYDVFGRVTAKTDALGRTTSLTYNAAAGASGCQTCNASSLATLVTLPSGRQIHRRYNADKKLIEESITTASPQSSIGAPPKR